MGSSKGAAEETTERAKKKEYEMGQDVKGKARQVSSTLPLFVTPSKL